MTAASNRPVALVTGASSGIGLAAATRLAQNGFAGLCQTKCTGW